MSLIDHLRELRRRIIIVLLVIGAGSVGGWFAYPHVLGILEHPYCSVPAGHRYDGAGGRCVLVYQGVLDGFNTRLRIALLTGTVATAPIWLYQLWAFVAPGLYSHEKKMVLPLVVTSTVLFFVGVAFCYFIVIPALTKFIVGVSSASINVAPDIEQYFGTVLTLFLVFGLAFEVPVAVIVLVRVGVVNVAQLRKSRGYFIVGAFVAAAIVTPPDIISQLSLAIPMCFLYEAGIVAAQIFLKKTKAPEPDTADKPAA